MSARVTVLIPTFRRPESVERAIRSVLEQAPPATAEVEIVVVDNDPEGDSTRGLSRLQPPPGMTLKVVNEPRPGVANARNAGLEASSGELIAFLDDDETAEPGWLAALVEAQARFQADAVFGPVRAAVPAGKRDRAFLETFFSRTGPDESGPVARHWGCGNSLVRRAALPPAPVFAAARNHIGGEDDLLFQTMARAGARFAWCAEAKVIEHPEPSRLTLRYALKRGFAFGQGPASAAFAAGPARWPTIPFWMGWGLLQAFAYALLSLPAAADRRAFVLDRAARGLGKCLWFPPFKLRFYGAVA